MVSPNGETVRRTITGFVYRNKQAIVGAFIGIFVSLILHITGIGAFYVGAVLTGLGVLFDYLDGGDRDV